MCIVIEIGSQGHTVYSPAGEYPGGGNYIIFRDNPLGSVKQLARDVTIDPAMLFHLNGYLNSKLAPDENYARELQELFTVGRGPGSGYDAS